MVACTLRSSPKPLRKRSVARSSSSTDPASIGSVEARVGQRAEHGLAQQQDLGEQLGARLIDVAMDQVLQPTGFALELRQDLVGLAHLAHVVPGCAEHLGAVPDQAASTITTAELSAAIDRIRQRIGIARERRRLVAARPASSPDCSYLVPRGVSEPGHSTPWMGRPMTAFLLRRAIQALKRTGSPALPGPYGFEIHAMITSVLATVERRVTPNTNRRQTAARLDTDA